VRTLHVGRRVDDLDASIRFYRHLGYEVVGDVNLRQAALRRPRSDELEVRHLHRPLVGELAGHRDARRGLVHGVLRVGGRRDHALGRDPAELPQEVEVEPLAPELAVRDAVDPGVGELGDHRGDLAILDLAQSPHVEPAGAERRSGRMDRRRAEEAPDVIGAERGAMVAMVAPSVAFDVVPLSLPAGRPPKGRCWSSRS
jgi:catechol 2,3-dioxygenase-like lactoylglutathione lyase family enzyme